MKTRRGKEKFINFSQTHFFPPSNSHTLTKDEWKEGEKKVNQEIIQESPQVEKGIRKKITARKNPNEVE